MSVRDPEEPGKGDEEILRGRLYDIGWRYSRRHGGRWIHPDMPGVTSDLGRRLISTARRAVTLTVLALLRLDHRLRELEKK